MTQKKSKFKNIKSPINSSKIFQENFNCLNILSHQKENKNYKKEQNYLLVTHQSFSKIKILDIDSKGKFIILKIYDYRTNENRNILVDTFDENDSYIFINWNDIREMVFNDTKVCKGDDDLLEFEF